MKQRKLKIAHSQHLLGRALKYVTKGMTPSCYAINARKRSISSRLGMATVPRQFSQRGVNMKPIMATIFCFGGWLSLSSALAQEGMTIQQIEQKEGREKV